MKNYINKGTAQKLIKLGIFESQINYGRNRSIFDLLEKLPRLYRDERLSIFKDIDCYEVGYPYQDIRIWHKSLAEALARLLIKLPRKGLL